MNRGAAGQALFLDRQDYEFFMRTLAAAKQEFDFLIHAYCLMPNHFHLMLQLGQIQASIFMHFLQTRFATVFNLKYERWGHVFHRRFKDIVCNTDSYYLALARYIHLNPVRAGLAIDAAAWPWSSHRDILAGDDSFVEAKAVLGHFGETDSTAKANYLKFLTEDSGPSDLAIGRATFGSVEELAHVEPWTADLAPRVLDAIRAKHDNAVPGDSRKRFIAEARAVGFSLTELSDYLRVSRATLYRSA